MKVDWLWLRLFTTLVHNSGCSTIVQFRLFNTCSQLRLFCSQLKLLTTQVVKTVWLLFHLFFLEVDTEFDNRYWIDTQSVDTDKIFDNETIHRVTIPTFDSILKTILRESILKILRKELLTLTTVLLTVIKTQKTIKNYTKFENWGELHFILLKFQISSKICFNIGLFSGAILIVSFFFFVRTLCHMFRLFSIKKFISFILTSLMLSQKSAIRYGGVFDASKLVTWAPPNMKLSVGESFSVSPALGVARHRYYGVHRSPPSGRGAPAHILIKYIGSACLGTTTKRVPPLPPAGGTSDSSTRPVKTPVLAGV